MQCPFVKYSGCGNDFIFIDNRKPFFPYSEILIQKMCARRTGIGADGVILLENSAHADFRMRIFNADGREAEMCGNGVRCLIKFMQELGIDQTHCRLETMERLIETELRGECVAVKMGNPVDFRCHVPITIGNTTYHVHTLNTGVPHAVLFTDCAETFDLKTLGAQFRHHSHFKPAGSNFNVAQLLPDGIIYNRTFERGVEDETLACGTGCTATALAAAVTLGLPSPLQIRTRSQEILEISFCLTDGHPENITMTGPAIRTFSGVYNL